MKRWLLIILLLLNCATSGVKIKMYQPANDELSGIKRIAISDVLVDGILNHNLVSIFEAEFSEDNFFSFISAGEIASKLRNENFQSDDLKDISKASEICLATGIDALIIAKILAYKVDPDEKGADKIVKSVWTGKYERDAEGKIIEIEENGELNKKKLFEQKTINQKYTIRTGRVEIEFILIDGKSGNIAFVNSYAHDYNSGKIPDEQLKDLKSEQLILKELTSDVVRDFKQAISPKLVTDRRQIESGEGFIDEGKIYALDNLWNEAIETWHKAEHVFPEQSTVFYNLGIAYEAVGDIDRAEEYFRKSIVLKPNKRAENAIKKIRKQRSRKEKRLIELMEKYSPADLLQQKEVE